MNPARSIAAAFAFWKFNHIFIYIIATICGGCAAGLCYDKIFLSDVQAAYATETEARSALRPSYLTAH
jgi:hypothetical protein